MAATRLGGSANHACNDNSLKKIPTSAHDRLTLLSNVVAYVCRLSRKEARHHVPSSRPESVRQAAVSAGGSPSPARTTAAEG